MIWNYFHNEESGTKNKQDWAMIFFRGPVQLAGLLEKRGNS